jgi:hypothetical protein
LKLGHAKSMLETEEPAIYSINKGAIDCSEQQRATVHANIVMIENVLC